MADDFDRQLKREFQAAFPDSTNPSRTLQELGPEMTRARRKRQATTAISSTLAAIVLVVGVGAATQSFDSEQPVQVAHDGDRPATSIPPDPTSPTGSVAATADDGSSTTVFAGPATTHPDQASEAVAPGQTSTTTTSATAATSQTTIASTTEVPPAPTTSSVETTSTTAVPSTTTAPTTTLAPETVIDSDCGSVTVAITGDTIILLEVNPDPGMIADRKNAGPESIEVSFEGPGGHCEIEAEIKNGALDADISYEPPS